MLADTLACFFLLFVVACTAKPLCILHILRTNVLETSHHHFVSTWNHDYTSIYQEVNQNAARRWSREHTAVWPHSPLDDSPKATLARLVGYVC
jgi:hypothetical protein